MGQSLAANIGELRASGHQREGVKEELRRNLMDGLQHGDTIFPGIVGYDDTVLPQLANAIIAGHDVILLGERGQAKSRLMRALASLLDERTPIVAGCEINDHPYAPICQRCIDLVREKGEATAVAWVGRERRYAEKLATPDISIADLIGEVDPIKVAEGRYLSDELTIHFGLIPRANRGIFGINELPDLAERIQVGLLNVMEEKDVQIRGYMVRMPLDLMVVASANPEDYTARGRIITPLKDRFGSQVRTHYPSEIEQEITIMEAEAATPPAGVDVYVPPFMKEVVAEITHLARRSPRIAQSSGVSVRMSIGNYENLISNAIRRCLRVREHLAVPRISDLRFLAPSTMGKIEIEALDEGKEGQVLQRIQNSAVAAVFGRHFGAGQFPRLLDYFAAGATIEAGDGMPSSGYSQSFAANDELEGALKRLHLPDQPATRASLTELVLEGLHLTKRLNKTEAEGGAIYQQ